MIDPYKNVLIKTRNLQISNENFSTKAISDECFDSSSFKNLSLLNLNFTHGNFDSSFFKECLFKNCIFEIRSLQNAHIQNINKEDRKPFNFYDSLFGKKSFISSETNFDRNFSYLAICLRRSPKTLS